MGIEKKKVTAIERSPTVLALCYLVLILSLRNLQGFVHLWFPQEKHCVHCFLCLIVVLVILSVKDPNNASLMLKI